MTIQYFVVYTDVLSIIWTIASICSSALDDIDIVSRYPFIGEIIGVDQKTTDFIDDVKRNSCANAMAEALAGHNYSAR